MRLRGTAASGYLGSCVPSPSPFWLRRPWLLANGLLTDRDRPRLTELGAIEDGEEFVWAILPHAARTFSACIALLPAPSALAAAVGYLYSRMLDTYEDLVTDHAECDASLRAFAARFDAGEELAPAPRIDSAADRDDRDRAHLLLVRRAHLVDRVYRELPASTREVIRDLVREMADGMCWSRHTMAQSGGVLTGEDHVARYCRNVLGNPVVFSIRLMRLAHGAPPELAPEELEHAMRVGEMVQLANITRDVEKDLRRGVAYDARLREYLGRDAAGGDSALAERCREVREGLLRMALLRAPSYAVIIQALRLPRYSVARASAILMLLFTERYFRGCARRAGINPWKGPDGALSLIARTLPTVFSRARAAREVARVEQEFLAAAHRALPA